MHDTNTWIDPFGLQSDCTGTVWDDIKVTQPELDSILPKSMELTTEFGRFWVHPNGTKHMKEYISHIVKEHKISGEPLNLSIQIHLKSLQSAVSEAAKKGIKYGEMINEGGWELIFSAPRSEGLLPVLKHALGK